MAKRDQAVRGFELAVAFGSLFHAAKSWQIANLAIANLIDQIQLRGSLRDQPRQVAPFEARVDVHHRHVGHAAIEHRQQRREPARS